MNDRYTVLVEGYIYCYFVYDCHLNKTVGAGKSVYWLAARKVRKLNRKHRKGKLWTLETQERWNEFNTL